MENVKIEKQEVIGTDATYEFKFDGWSMLMEMYDHRDVEEGVNPYEVIIYDLETESEICILDTEYEINTTEKAWGFVLYNSHTLMRNIWKRL